MKQTIIAFILFCLTAGSAAAQNKRYDGFEPGKMPARLRPLLDKRIEQFVEAQRQQEWDRVSDFLAENQKNPPGLSYSNEQKQCVIELIKAAPMIDFTYRNFSFSTYNFNVPLNKRYWGVYGDAEFQTDAGRTKQSIFFYVRYFNRNWYFSIPRFYLDEWRKRRPAAPPADLSGLLTVIEEPGRPVEVFDVSLKIDPANPERRVYGFTIRNKTKKKIVSYEYLLENFTVAGRVNDLKPGADAADGGSYDTNLFFCEVKERLVRLRISGVRFADGTRWKSRLQTK